MHEKISAAMRKRWAKVPKKQRCERMAELARKRHEKLTPLQRKRIARKLVNARQEKRAAREVIQ